MSGKKVDAGQMPAWNVEMAIAWILWRVLDAAAEYYRDESNHQEPRVVSFDRLNLDFICEKVGGDARPIFVETAQKAKHQLWEKFTAGELVATGMRGHTAELEIISPHLWAHLMFKPDYGSGEIVVRNGADFYTSVTLRRDDVIRLWPDINTEEQEAEASTPDIIAHSAAPASMSPKKGRNKPAIAKAMRAIRALWPDGYVEPYVQRRNGQINDWLLSQKLGGVSAPKINEAMEIMNLSD
jgi:hypothetical protein